MFVGPGGVDEAKVILKKKSIDQGSLLLTLITLSEQEARSKAAGRGRGDLVDWVRGCSGNHAACMDGPHEILLT
jgi:hypothetical protein